MGLNLYSEYCCIFDPLDIKKKDVAQVLEEETCQIYLICKRKKMYYESCIKMPDGNSVITMYSLDANHNKVYYKYADKDLFINDYSGGYFRVAYNGQQMEIRDFILINSFHFLENDRIGSSVREQMPTDLEVMYVGQTFGRNADKTIGYRIAKHEQIQQIALEIIKNGANEEILVIGIRVKENDVAMSIVTFDKNNTLPTIKELRDLQRDASMRPIGGQKITLYEASLITYFQSECNKEYRNTFPSSGYSSYDEVYGMNFDHISFVLDSYAVGVRLYSANQRERKYAHTSYYPLDSEIKKKGFIEYLEEYMDIK